MIRVLIVDGEAKVRRGLRMRLGIEPDIAVIGETGSAEESLRLAQTLAPDVVVIDIGRRGLGSANIIQHLRRAAPAAAVVVLTLCSDEDTRAWAHEAGAQAFLEKRGGATDLLQTIRQLAPGQLLRVKQVAAAPSATRRPSVG